jgi:spore germination cell wall hydrolase CwlJ-like protein
VAVWALVGTAILSDFTNPVTGPVAKAAVADAAKTANVGSDDSVVPVPHPYRVTEENASAALRRMIEAKDSSTAAVQLASVSLQSAAQEMEREITCLATAIYHEARSETYSGQIAVAEVVINRVRDRQFPNSVCGVVYQGQELTTGCQFSFTCDGSLNKGAGGRSWARAERIARNVLYGMTQEVTGSATHYHADYVSPRWANGFVRTKKIGRHIFYRHPAQSAAVVDSASEG